MGGVKRRQGLARRMGAVRKIPPPLLKLGPGDPCPCGSGRTMKECCGAAFKTLR